MKTKLFKNKEQVLSCLFISIISIVLAISFLNLWGYDFNIPLNYGDGDYLLTSRVAKSVDEFGQYFVNHRLGAPFEAINYDFPVYGDRLHIFVMKVLSNIFGNYGLAINIYFILLFPLTSVSSYFVMKKLKINNTIAILASITYSFLPYRFLRSTAHLFLSAYTLIPLSILILIWLAADENLFKIDKTFFKYKKNYATIIILMLIGISGVYYAFFMCFFIGITIMIIYLKNIKQFKNILRGIICIGVIVSTLLISAIPTFYGIYRYGSSSEAPIRSSIEAEIYGMKITQLFIPNQSHGISTLDKLISNYGNAPLPNEASEYLGIVGIVGFMFLMVLLLINLNEDNEEQRTLMLLSKLNLWAVLLATIGGFGSIFAIIISPQIRGYNRISVYIAYFSILALSYGLSIMYYRYSKKLKKIIVFTSAVVFTVGIFEQSIINTNGYEANISSYYSDQKFVKEIEEQVEKNSMIFQLPYYKFPEIPPMNRMGDYALTRGYLHSNSLRWSYGDYKGRKSDLWNRQVSELPINQLIEKISFVGFDGIYIDTYAYTQAELFQLMNEIEKVLNNKPLVSDDSRLLFYNLLEYNNKNKAKYSEEEWIENEKNSLEIPPLWGKGFSTQEGNENGYWRWCDQEGELILYNNDSIDRSTQLELDAYTGYDEDSNLIIEYNNMLNKYKINSKGEKIYITLDLQPGENIIRFSTDSKQIEVPNDPRKLFFRIYNFKLIKN